MLCVEGLQPAPAGASAPYFPHDAAEPPWQTHAAALPRALERAHDPQAHGWLMEQLEAFRASFVALHERLDQGHQATIADHEMRRMSELQSRVERHLDFVGNPVDAAVNHTLRRLGLPPAFGQVDRQVWKDVLTREEIAQGMRPRHKGAVERRLPTRSLLSGWNLDLDGEALDRENEPDEKIVRELGARLDCVLMPESLLERWWGAFADRPWAVVFALSLLSAACVVAWLVWPHGMAVGP